MRRRMKAAVVELDVEGGVDVVVVARAAAAGMVFERLVDELQRIRELVRLQAESFGVRAEIAWRPGYAVLVNDAQQTARALAVAQKHFPPEQINPQGPMVSGSEDFAFMLERVPGCYLFIGNGAGGEPGACMVHNPAYDFNDHNIAAGAAYWIALVNELLSPC